MTTGTNGAQTAASPKQPRTPTDSRAARPLRVLYSFSSRLGQTGIGTTAWHQVSGLVKEGNTLRVYSPSCDKPLEDPAGAQVRQTWVLGSWHMPIVSFGPIRPLRLHDWQVARVLPRLADKIDVVHCWSGASLRTLAMARKLGIPTFLERPNAHTGYAFEVVAREYEKLNLTIDESHSHAFSRARLEREQAEYDLADYLLCPSDFVARTFAEKGFPQDRIARHQYGYDPTHFVAPSDGKGDQPLRAIFVGSCEPRKGLHYALDAWLASAASRDGQFHICGQFVPGYRAFLARQLAHRSVVEHGFTRNVAEIMRQSDVLVLPSIEEGSALVSYEARACGCVLLVSEAAGAPCRHMHNALVHPVADVATLQDHFTKLATDRSLRATLRANSLATIDELTWQHAAKVLTRCYRSALPA